jgi:hypothetical protein
MTDILIKIAVVVALLAALFFGEQYIEGRGYDRARAEDNAAIEKVKREAADTLASETNKTRTAEQALQDFKNTQELQDATHQKTVADLSSRLRNLAGAPGRLRDPHAAGCGPSGGSTPSEAAPAPGGRPADPTEAGGLLSADLSGLLQRLQLEADTINVAYASCRADAYTVRGEH